MSTGLAVTDGCIQSSALRPRARCLLLLQRGEAALRHLACRRGLSCLVVVLVALGMRALLLPLIPIPIPHIHDEFSYLLGGETLAMGRLSNPPHPMWRFFETIHVNMQPTYASKYPPAQAAFLAFGIRLLGHPWYGVWLSTGLLCGALCWMLQGWLPPIYGIIGGLLAAMQLAVDGYWVNSYWGGSVPALGGALAIGALPRLVRKPGAGAAGLAAAGILILANSRPFEGVILLGLLAIAFVWWSRRCSTFRRALKPEVLAPILIGVVVTAVSIAYYDWKVTGNIWSLPYIINSRQYHWSPPLWFLPASPPPARFRDAAMQHFWEWDHYDLHEKARKNPLRVINTFDRAVSATFVEGPGSFLALPLLAGMFLCRSTRARIAALLLGAFILMMFSEQYILAHYLAPGLGLLLLSTMFGLRLFRTIKVRRAAIGLPLVAAILVSCVALTVGTALRHIILKPPEDAMTYRARTLALLNASPGRHLVMVRYSSGHDFHEEHVYNGPDIDAQKVIWALDRGPDEDKTLFRYYAGRTIWLYSPDGPSPSLHPWQ